MKLVSLIVINFIVVVTDDNIVANVVVSALCSLNICLTLFDVTIEFLLGGLVVAYGNFHVKFSLVEVEFMLGVGVVPLLALLRTHLRRAGSTPRQREHSCVAHLALLALHFCSS